MTTQANEIRHYAKENWLSSFLNEISDWIEPFLIFQPIEILDRTNHAGMSLNDIKAIHALRAK